MGISKKNFSKKETRNKLCLSLTSDIFCNKKRHEERTFFLKKFDCLSLQSSGTTHNLGQLGSNRRLSGTVVRDF